MFKKYFTLILKVRASIFKFKARWVSICNSETEARMKTWFCSKQGFSVSILGNGTAARRERLSLRESEIPMLPHELIRQLPDKLVWTRCRFIGLSLSLSSVALHAPLQNVISGTPCCVQSGLLKFLMIPIDLNRDATLTRCSRESRCYNWLTDTRLLFVLDSMNSIHSLYVEMFTGFSAVICSVCSLVCVRMAGIVSYNFE